MHTYLRCSRPRKNEARYARRGVCVTGYGAPAFDDIATSKAIVHDVFVKAGIGRVLPPTSDVFRDYYCFHASNQYFTLGRLAKHETYIPYPEDEDPAGVLHAWHACSDPRDDLVRIPENAVEFFGLEIGEDEQGER